MERLRVFVLMLSLIACFAFNYRISSRPMTRIALAPLKLSPQGEAALEVYKRKYPSPRPGGEFDVKDLDARFISLSKVLKSEELTLQAVKNCPEVLALRTSKVNEIFAIYDGKWGFEKARGVIVRNPSLLALRATGYGSAEVAGDETVYVSYLLDITRPIGKPLLAILLILLAKPFVYEYLPFVSGTP